jgi:hypothetical protein
VTSLVADVREKLADARKERLKFVETFEHLVKVGVGDRAWRLDRECQQRHTSDEFAQHSQEAGVGGRERRSKFHESRFEPWVEFVVRRHGRSFVLIAIGGKA